MHNFKKRVVIIQRYIPHYRVSFFEKLHENTSKEFNVEVYFGKLMDKELVLSDLNFPCKQFDLFKVKIFGYSIEAQWKLFFSLIRNPPDLVILEGTFGIISNILLLFTRRLTNKKTIYWTAGWDNPEISGWKHRIKTIVIKFLLLLSNGAIAYGSEAKKYLIKHGLNENKITIAQNTINIEAIIDKSDFLLKQREIIRKKYNVIDKKVIVFSGSLIKRKKINLLLRAYKSLNKNTSNFALFIIGEGPELYSIEKYIEENQLQNIFLLGKIITNLEDILCACDVFVLPGTGGLAINQALAVGLPVIASESDGTEKDLIIEGFNGNFFRNNDSYFLAKLIMNAINSFSYVENQKEIQLQLLKTASLNNQINVFHKTIFRQLN